ncbi:MAG: hypothetical protein K6E40_16065 [Desulfovibrio sp.]|nr:hypothetical protein [Desulfovibrio sp.]
MATIETTIRAADVAGIARTGTAYRETVYSRYAGYLLQPASQPLPGGDGVPKACPARLVGKHKRNS